MNKIKKKKNNLIGFLVAAIITGIFMFALLGRMPIYGISSNFIVMLPEGKSQSYANHVTGNIAGIIQNTFDDKKIAGRPTSIVVKNTPNSGLITINVYKKDTAKAFKLHKTLIDAMEREILLYYPKSTGIKIKSVGQSYKTTRLSYVFGTMIIAIIVGWLLTIHISGLIYDFFPKKDKEEDEYVDVGSPSSSLINKVFKQKKCDDIKNVFEENKEKEVAYTWSDLGGSGDSKNINHEISENNKNYNIDKNLDKKNTYAKIEKINNSITKIESSSEDKVENGTVKTEAINKPRTSYFDDEVEEYVENDSFIQRELLNENIFDTEILNDEEKVNSEFKITENKNKLNNFVENESSISHNNLMRMPIDTKDAITTTEGVEHEKMFDDRKKLNDIESNNITQIISNEVIETDRDFYVDKEVNKKEIISKNVEIVDNKLEKIDSKKNNEYLNSLGPMGFDRIDDVKIPNRTYEYISKNNVEKSSNPKKIEEIRNNFNNALTSIGNKGGNDLTKEKGKNKKQLNEIINWTDVNKKITNQFRDFNITNSDFIDENESFDNIIHTSNDAINEVDEDIFSNSVDYSNLNDNNYGIKKTITGGLALPEIEEKYEDIENKNKKKVLEEKEERKIQSQKSNQNLGATTFVPGNLPIVDMNLEIDQEKTDNLDKVNIEGGKMIAKFDKEPSDEDLKRRLNELLNGSM